MKRWAMILVVALAACGNPTPAPKTPVPEPSASEGAVAPVTIVDLDGSPLADMQPIASREPNAFEAPVAQGPLTDAQGHCEFDVPTNEHVFVRGWDPNLKYFANNFYEIAPGPATKTEPMTLVMVLGASLDVTVIYPNGQPIANTAVDIMMLHPEKGPWWPDRATTTSAGVVHFDSLPAGQFTILMKNGDGLRGEVDDVLLRPGAAETLGDVILRPSN